EQDFVHAPAAAVEHAQPGCTGAVGGVRNMLAFGFPPGFVFTKRALVGQRPEHVLQEVDWGAENVEFHIYTHYGTDEGRETRRHGDAATRRSGVAIMCVD